MDPSLIKIFITIDSLDADENIKKFYKDLVLLEFNNVTVRYKEKYERLLKTHMEDL